MFSQNRINEGGIWIGETYLLLLMILITLFVRISLLRLRENLRSCVSLICAHDVNTKVVAIYWNGNEYLEATQSFNYRSDFSNSLRVRIGEPWEVRFLNS